MELESVVIDLCNLGALTGVEAGVGAWSALGPRLPSARGNRWAAGRAARDFRALPGNLGGDTVMRRRPL